LSRIHFGTSLGGAKPNLSANISVKNAPPPVEIRFAGFPGTESWEFCNVKFHRAPKACLGVTEGYGRRECRSILNSNYLGNDGLGLRSEPVFPLRGKDLYSFILPLSVQNLCVGVRVSIF